MEGRSCTGQRAVSARYTKQNCTSRPGFDMTLVVSQPDSLRELPGVNHAASQQIAPRGYLPRDQSFGIFRARIAFAVSFSKPVLQSSEQKWSL